MGRVIITAALIAQKERLLVARRPPGKKFGLLWEFPGGKVEPGEGFEQALIREIREELCLDIRVEGLFKTVSRREPGLECDLHAYWCKICGGTLCLLEHVALQWATVSELKNMELTMADRSLMPFLEELREFP
jgi:8-oxo-dGTP diphosphatase